MQIPKSYFIIQKILSFIPIFILLSFLAGCVVPIKTDMTREAPVTITFDSDGEEVRVNLVKFVGSASSNQTQVWVNDVPVIINQDGSYYAYVQLKRGLNAVRVTTVDGSMTRIKCISIWFRPLLAVIIDEVEWAPVGQLMKVTGRVSIPEAHVILWEENRSQVDDLKDAIVTDNGTFYGLVMRNHEGTQKPDSGHGYYTLDGVSARATFDQESDKCFEAAPGQISVPGSGISYDTKWHLSNDEIHVKPGEKAIIDCIIEIKKNVFAPSNIQLSVLEQPPDAAEYSYGPKGLSPAAIPTTTGLRIEPTPAAFDVYMNTEYRIPVNITVSADVQPGVHKFAIFLTNPSWVSGGWLTLIVEPK